MLTEQGRRAGLAVSGQTIAGLIQEVRTVGKRPCGALVFTRANDVENLASAVLKGDINLEKAQDTLRAAMRKLVRLLTRTFSGKIVFCETISCRWKRFDEDWHRVSAKLEYAVCRVPRQREHVGLVFVPVNHLLNREHYEKFIGPYQRRDYIHLNHAGYAVVAQHLGPHK